MPSYRASDGAQLAYTDEGPQEGPPLLFVHGWQADSRVWGPLLAHLERPHRVLTVDLRGSGGSSGAPGPYRVEKFASDLSDLVESLDVDPTVVIGHSMGSLVAQRFAIDRPHAVEALVLIAALPAARAPFSPKAVDFFRRSAGDPDVRATWLKALTLRAPSAEVATLLAGAAATWSREAVLESLESWLDAGFGDEAATIETPTLVLAPSDDRPMTPQVLQATVADIIVGSALEVVAESGHYAPVEQPEWLAHRIERYVEEL
jgi:pimeloyl-ACP methyl ester carboxylesterase